MKYEMPEWVGEFKEWYSRLHGGERFVFWWLSSVAVALLVVLIWVGFTWPIAGIIILGILALLTTIGCIAFVLDEW